MTNLFGHSIRSEIILLYITESLLCFAAFYLVLQLGIGVLPVERSDELAIAGILAGCAGLASGVSGLYQPANWLRARRLLLGGLTTAMVLLVMVQLIFPALLPTRLDSTLWQGSLAIVSGFMVALMLTRLLLVTAARSGLLRRRVIVLQGPEGGQSSAAMLLAQDPFLDVALVLPANAALAEALSPARLRSLHIWAVIAGSRSAVPPALTSKLSEQGVRFYNEEEFFERRLCRVDLSRLPADWTAPQARGNAVEAAVRRSFDIGLSLTLLLFTLPLLLLTALAIRIDSRGPIFYQQERVGRGGRTFGLLKFRSMVVDAEVAGAPQWATRRDPRVTRIGRFLRLTRIDEIPQALNVLRGDMAFVGPRPERPAFVEQLSQQIPHFDKRALVKPGITGWAQVNYPYGASVEDARMKLAYDLYYIERRSLFLDLLILVATVRVVLFQEGSR